MTFSASSTPDISESIPVALSSAQDASRAASNQGAKFDVTIGGVGFNLSPTLQTPYIRQTAPVQKQQFDSSKEAGEQTLGGDWVRSQTSWHHGAGARFYEPGSDASSTYRFEESLGMDVFTRDRATLLKKTTLVGAVSAGQTAYVTGAVVGGADVLFTNENGVVKRRSNTGAVLATYTPSADAPDGRPILGGGRIYVGATSFGIDYGDANGSALTRLYVQAINTTPKVYWAKARLIAARDTKLFELAPDGSSGTTPGNLDTVTPLYTHPDSGWTWSSVVEAPTAILASGYSNGYSAVYRFALEDATAGTTPKLSQAYQIAEMPLGEEILSLHVHLGRYVGIGTTRGIRVGLIGDSGTVQYGPLLVECGAVRSIRASDRFLYGAVTAAQPDGKSGLVAVDLSEEVEANTLRFPYAWHARTGTTGRADSAALLGASGRVAIGVFGEGVYLQSATDYEPEGWVRSGRIRFATVEPKRFRTADVGVSLTDGQVGLYVVSTAGYETYIRNLTAQASDGRGISLTAGADAPQEYLQIKIRLTSSADKLISPSLDSVQIRAVPVVNRQELIQYPLLCIDREQTPTGTKYGKPGWAFMRLAALKAIEQEQAITTVTDRTTGETFQAQIEQVEFRRPMSPSADGRGNFGGILVVTVRK